MIALNCPSCGATVDFLSKASVFAVCSYCRSTLVRHDMNLEAIGKMAELQDDLTPLQIGTKGTYEDRAFELIGRMRIGWYEAPFPDLKGEIVKRSFGGFWNEWYALYDGQQECWLAEAQGFLAICFPYDGNLTELPVSLRMHPGLQLIFGKGKAYTVDDIKEVDCVLSEGELPLNAVQGRKAISVDVSTSDGHMGTIEYPDFGWRASATPQMPKRKRTNKLDRAVRSLSETLNSRLSYLGGSNTPQEKEALPEEQPEPLPELTSRAPIRAFVGKYVDFDKFKFTNIRKIDGW